MEVVGPQREARRREHPPRASLALAPADRGRLLEHLNAAVRRSRGVHGHQVLAGITVQVGRAVDPTAVVCAARGDGEAWTALEQPDRDRWALATLGCAVALEASGPDRFATVARRWREIARDACCDADVGGRGAPGGMGAVAVGGFAFADDGGRAPHWTGFAPASLQRPRRRPRPARGGRAPDALGARRPR